MSITTGGLSPPAYLRDKYVRRIRFHTPVTTCTRHHAQNTTRAVTTRKRVPRARPTSVHLKLRTPPVTLHTINIYIVY